MFVDKSMITQAYAADLYDYMCTHYPSDVKRTEHNLYLKNNKSLVIHVGSYGYKDYATGETGNGIDFLMRHMNYSFQEAVMALSGTDIARSIDASPSAKAYESATSKTIQIPQAASPPFSRLYAFLMSRGIPKSLITSLVREGLLYQSKGNNNIVFINPERDYFEMRGTYTLGEKAFHGCGKTLPDRFWYLKGGSTCTTVYITEASIDAISLFLLQKKQGLDTRENVYVSIGGVANYATIDRIKKHKRTILAVDNDEAGARCRKRYSDLEFTLPIHKDWNEDLMKGAK